MPNKINEPPEEPVHRSPWNCPKSMGRHSVPSKGGVQPGSPSRWCLGSIVGSPSLVTAWHTSSPVRHWAYESLVQCGVFGPQAPGFVSEARDSLMRNGDRQKRPPKPLLEQRAARVWYSTLSQDQRPPCGHLQVVHGPVGSPAHFKFEIIANAAWLACWGH